MDSATELMIEMGKEAHEAEMMKRLLKQRLELYSGITYQELVDICTMLGIRKDGDRNESV